MTETKPDTQQTHSSSRFSRPGVLRLQRLVVDLVVDVLIVLVLAVLVWAVVGLARDVFEIITTSSAEGYKTLAVELLTVFVFIELFHSLTEYLRFRRVQITTLLDASIAFVLRETWIGMYGGEMGWQTILALALFLLALGATRTLAVIYSPGRDKQSGLAEE